MALYSPLAMIKVAMAPALLHPTKASPISAMEEPLDGTHLSTLCELVKEETIKSGREHHDNERKGG